MGSQFHNLFIAAIPLSIGAYIPPDSITVDGIEHDITLRGAAPADDRDGAVAALVHIRGIGHLQMVNAAQCASEVDSNGKGCL
ncbi:hypothetical protein D3C76_1081030 [compost metagenome]